MSVRRPFSIKKWICLLLLAMTIWTVPLVARTDMQAPAQLIVVLQLATSEDSQSVLVGNLLDHFGDAGLLQLNPLGIDGATPDTPAYQALLAPDADANHLIQELARLPSVLYVEPDVRRESFDIDPEDGPLDEQFQYGFQDYYRDIGVLKMWARGITGIQSSRPITVAVIDSGVDLNHPDIDDNLVAGYDFVDEDNLPQDESDDSHGSMVAGVVGAEINNDLSGGVARGVAGIGGGDAQAGTLGLRIMPLRISPEVYCSQSAQAIDYARNHGATVVNMSYGGEDFCQLELVAIQGAYDAGITLVAGAGNDGASTPFYPAAYGAESNDSLVIAVAGVIRSGSKAADSNYGDWVDISAPFVVRSIDRHGGYETDGGTSFSAPLVSGLIGLMMSNQGWTRESAVSIVLATADNIDDVNPSYQGLLGAGRINADRATSLTNMSYLPIVRTG